MAQEVSRESLQRLAAFGVYVPPPKPGEETTNDQLWAGRCETAGRVERQV